MYFYLMDSEASESIRIRIQNRLEIMQWKYTRSAWIIEFMQRTESQIDYMCYTHWAAIGYMCYAESVNPDLDVWRARDRSFTAVASQRHSLTAYTYV